MSSSSSSTGIESIISLTTKDGVRYEGFSSFNNDDPIIKLVNVRSFGTEGRNANGAPVMPSNKVSEYLLFRGSDIKDLRVISSHPVYPTQPINSDPAIIQPPPPTTSLSLLATDPSSDPNTYNPDLGQPGTTLQGGLRPLHLGQPGQNVGSQGPSSSNAIGNGLEMPMGWSRYCPQTNELPLLRSVPDSVPVESQPLMLQHPVQQENRNPNPRRVHLDMISRLPPAVLGSILSYIPIQEAVRTSICSRQWRFNWMNTHKLVFKQHKFQDLKCVYPMTTKDKFLSIIYHVLILHQGPISDFTLAMDGASESCSEIDVIINALWLRTNTVSKFKLKFKRKSGYSLSSNIFNFKSLKALHLKNCQINFKQPFAGFPNLTTLSLYDVNISAKTLVHLLSRSQSLKSCYLNPCLVDVLGDEKKTILELFKYLPLIEKLMINFWVTEHFTDDVQDQQRLPTSLVHLKELVIENITFSSDLGLPFLLLLMRSSPNMESLMLEMYVEVEDRTSFTFRGYSDMRMQHLKELDIEKFIHFQPHLEFVKFVLTKSPVLKKVRIILDAEVTAEEQLEISTILESSPRASLWVEISFARANGILN